jgi:hypothetical protein
LSWAFQKANSDWDKGCPSGFSKNVNFYSSRGTFAVFDGPDNLKCFSHLGESKNAACGKLYFAPIDPDHRNRVGLNFFLDKNRRSGIEASFS